MSETFRDTVADAFVISAENGFGGDRIMVFYKRNGQDAILRLNDPHMALSLGHSITRAAQSLIVKWKNDD